jgi:phosphatidate cytidylyltransferase
MTQTRETVLLFAGIGAVLVLASVIGWLLKQRVAKGEPHGAIDNLNARIRAWWAMVAVIGLAFLFGKEGVIVLFAFVSFFALREFITIAYTRRGDHLALALGFFFFLPLQYYLVLDEWYGLYSILIPVYAFLALPIVAAVSQDTTRFLERSAKVQWGLMIAVYCISHVPALLTLRIPGYEGRQTLLIVFLVLVVQGSDVLQYVWGKLFGRHKIAPLLSPSKTVEGFAGGVLSATALDYAVHCRAGGRNGAADRPARLLRRPGALRHQARPRHQGLGRHDRGPRRHAGPHGFGNLRRARLLPCHAVFLPALSARRPTRGAPGDQAPRRPGEPSGG